MAAVHPFKRLDAPSKLENKRFSRGLQFPLPGAALVDKIIASAGRHGLANTFHDVALKATNRFIFVKIYRGISVERAEPEFLKCPAKYSPGFLSESKIRECATSPENDMAPDFVEECLVKEDECYGIFHGDTLAAYGWYSHKPTPLEPDLLLHFKPEYVYMYKGYTHPKYRGERLHAVGMTLALQSYLSRGFKGLVSIVESNNFSSLKSVVRMGYAQVGSICAAKIFGRYLTFGTSGCEKFGLYLEQKAGPAPGL